MGECIKKGSILSIDGNKARVAPINNINLVSPSIMIANYINLELINKGTMVAYVMFEDNTGLIFAVLE